MSPGFKIALGAIGLVVLAAIFVPPFINVRDGKGYPRAKTRSDLRCIVSASQAYYEEYGRWPSALADLTNNPRKILFLEPGPDAILDGWRRPMLYQPFDKRLGYGSVLSLGKDGRHGGTGADEDLEIRFGEPTNGTNQASEATSGSAPGAASSSHQR